MCCDTYRYMSQHYVVHPKYMQFLFVNKIERSFQILPKWLYHSEFLPAMNGVPVALWHLVLPFWFSFVVVVTLELSHFSGCVMLSDCFYVCTFIFVKDIVLYVSLCFFCPLNTSFL
jgi:hypothetical protein